jgi:hypothetical protein
MLQLWTAAAPRARVLENFLLPPPPARQEARGGHQRPAVNSCWRLMPSFTLRHPSCAL